MTPFRQRVLDGEVVIGTFLLIDSPGTAEICARTGLDWVLIDLEHGLATEADLVAMLMAANGTGAAALVRVESGARIRVGRALDLGAAGIMVPQVQSADEAAAVARWIRLTAGRRARRGPLHPRHGPGHSRPRRRRDASRGPIGHRPDRIGRRARGSRRDGPASTASMSSSSARRTSPMRSGSRAASTIRASRTRCARSPALRETSARPPA